MTILPYTSNHKATWDDFVSGSRNGTFLFLRDFMEYHSDRFVDASILFVDDNGHVKGLLPASWHETSGEIRSHGGLTYGGLILSPRTHAIEVGEMIRLEQEYYCAKYYARRILVRPVPHIYHRQPSDDERYWLFRNGAKIDACAIASTIDLQNPGKRSTLRRRGVQQAQKKGLVKEEILLTDEAAWREYWELLTDILQRRHGVNPVHSLAEITMLAQRFPQHIRLNVVRCPDTHQILAGCVLFLSQPVAHVQYIGTSDEGRKCGALDLLFHILCEEYSRHSAYRYFDFGISTEQGGRLLNEGLNRQKEGFGARSIVYESFTLELQ